MGTAGLKQNVGDVDRVVRIVVGLVLIVVPPLVGWSAWAVAIAAALGGMSIVQGVTRHCVLYNRMGWSTAAPPRQTGQQDLKARS